MNEHVEILLILYFNYLYIYIYIYSQLKNRVKAQPKFQFVMILVGKAQILVELFDQWTEAERTILESAGIGGGHQKR